MIITPETLKLPGDWHAVKAREHLTLESGQRPTQFVTDNPEEVPSWGGENISDDGFVTLDNQRFLSREYFRSVGKGKVQIADILINKDGANTGKLAFVNRLPVEEVLVNEHVFIIRNRGEFDQRYLFEFLRSYLGQKQIKALIIGSAQPGLNTRFTKHVLLPKPDIDEQRMIGHLFAEIDSAITAARVSILKADRLQKGLMQQLLTGRLKPEGSLRGAKDFWGHPKAGFVPNGWEVSPLKGLAQVQRGKFSHRPRNEPRFYDGPYPFIQTGDVSHSRGYILSHAQTLSDEGARISRCFPKGTVFISIVGVNVAATAIASYDVYSTDSVIGMIPNAGVVSEYLEFYLRSVHQKLAVLAGDSARENLNYGILKPLLVKYPTDPEEQQHIANVLCNCDSLVRAKQQKIAALQRLKKSLMQNLLTGRVRLPEEGGVKEPKA